MQASFRTVVCLAAVLTAVAARADDLKIGLIAPFSGSETAGLEMDNGIKAFFKLHGDVVAGRKVIVISRDAPTPAPDVARRLAQELVTRDKVDVLAGHLFTPTAIAAGQVSTQSKTPMLIMNAATSGILAKFPYTARASFTVAQTTAPLARWVAKNGMKRVFTIVADYAPGIDSENAFQREFVEAGGTMTGSIRVPLDTIDFASYIRRIQDSETGGVFAFLPAPDQAKNFIKAFRDAGLDKKGVKLVVEGGMLQPQITATLDDDAIGIISSQHYSEDHQSQENMAFVEAYKSVSGNRIPTYISVGAFDAMNMLYKAVEAQAGKLDPVKSVEIWRNMKLESPRGPVSFDPQTRDIVQNIYIRRLERKNGILTNVEFETYDAVKDNGKQ
ncbi:ABC transporter substrate-binding protein [Roseiarcaceae bacterium H3SJ34-1]|uniref:ABC transporter substrate-binding protein n=1 Tax=Terripilifer ovatus TaxID=3032367 RepID=UPI003AB9B125|nr:ABC transporter substrate-binding protein [Roseiarcaceae bacterium H3SJ34-1]